MHLPSRPTPDDAPRHPGVLSIVLGDDAGSTRPLPVAYLENCPLFVDRDLATVQRVVAHAVEHLLTADERPTFFIEACRVGELFGLYIRDQMNRSPYRRRMSAAGAEFPSDPFVTLNEDARFEVEAWGPFEPRFVVLAADEEEDAAVSGAGFISFAVGAFRLGKMQPRDLMMLRRGLAGAVAVAHEDPAALVQEIRAL